MMPQMKIKENFKKKERHRIVNYLLRYLDRGEENNY